jgi:parvulin-like peptidyl-prolyl isomerase
MNMKRVLNLLFLSLIAAAAVFAQNDLQPAAIVQLTRSEPITVKQYRTELDRTEKQVGRPLSAAERRQVLDGMINEKLAIQAAERDKIIVNENEVNQQIQQLRNQMVQSIGRQPTETEFATAIRNESGLELPAFRELVRKQLITQKYLMSKKQDQINAVKDPTAAEIQEAYNLAKAQLVRPDTVRFSIIQIPYGNDAATKTKAKELADRLLREIDSNPAKFDETFIKAQVPNSGYIANEGGYLPRSTLAQQRVGADFLTAAFNLRQGEVSKLINGARSYQIIKVTETYGQKTLEMDDIFQLGSRITVREYITRALLQERQQLAVESATKELLSELRRGNPFQVFENNINW